MKTPLESALDVVVAKSRPSLTRDPVPFGEETEVHALRQMVSSALSSAHAQRESLRDAAAGCASVTQESSAGAQCRLVRPPHDSCEVSFVMQLASCAQVRSSLPAVNPIDPSKFGLGDVIDWTTAACHEP